MCDEINQYLKSKGHYPTSGDDIYSMYRCPVHDDRNPSFAVYTNQQENHQYFICYGCNIQGRLFHLVSAVEKITLQEARKKISGIDYAPSETIHEDIEKLNLLKYQYLAIVDVIHYFYKCYRSKRDLILKLSGIMNDALMNRRYSDMTKFFKQFVVLKTRTVENVYGLALHLIPPAKKPKSKQDEIKEFDIWKEQMVEWQKNPRGDEWLL